MSSEAFAAELRAAEDRLRAVGLTGRKAYAALARHLASRLGLPKRLWLDGPDAPETAQLERIPLTAELDLFGLAYERFFPDVFKAERGQYFTPRPLVELMADLARVRPDDRVLDPTCGSGSFMVVAHTRGADVDGIEIDPELVALCRLNLALHGIDPRSVRSADLFRDTTDETWDVILANPPFSVDINDPDTLRRFSMAKGRKSVSSDVLFLEAACDRLRPGGRLAVVLPRSLLANSTHASLREWMQARFVRWAVVSLPEGVFRPFGGTTTRAVVVCLQKRPAQVRRWRAAVVRNPGYDPTRKVYRRTEPDELAMLRIAWRQGSMRPVDHNEPLWLPEALLAESGIDKGVPTVALGDIAPLSEHQSIRPRDFGDERFTEVDLADIDKRTGEVTGGRVRKGSAFQGLKTPFEDGDLLFGRIRPKLNNVVLAARPDPLSPVKMCGSSEWVRLNPTETPYFSLVAARSTFVRAQLETTGGQTRPRVGTDDLQQVRVPFPGERSRALIDELTGEAHAVRMAARRRMDRIVSLYEAFGAGRIDADELEARLAELRAGGAPGAPPPAG